MGLEQKRARTTPEQEQKPGSWAGQGSEQRFGSTDPGIFRSEVGQKKAFEHEKRRDVVQGAEIPSCLRTFVPG
jgi:hypothetical protein